MKVRSIIFICIFCVLTALPLIFFTPAKTVSYSENRMLTALDFTYTGGIGDKIDVLDKWFSDHLGFRDEMFRYLMGAKYHVFGVINYLDMIEGSEGQWYSMDAYQEMDYTGVDSLLTEERLASDVEGLSRVNDFMKENGTPFVVMINPDKMEVEDQYLPKRYIKNDGNFRADKIAKALRENTDIPVVLSKEALLSYDGRYDSGNPGAGWDDERGHEHLFWESTDVTHWNYLGAFLAYEDLMDTLSSVKEVPVLSFDDAGFTVEDFDRSFIWGIEWRDRTLSWSIDNSMIVSDSDLPEELSYIDQYYHFHNTALEDEGTSILIAGDSYIQEYLMDLLKQSYTDIYYVLSYQNREAVVPMADIIHPDVVLFEWASRMYPRMEDGVGEGWGL